jgi:hypothetical protein
MAARGVCGRTDCGSESAVRLVFRTKGARRYWITEACEDHHVDQYDVGRQLRLLLVEAVGA